MQQQSTSVTQALIDHWTATVSRYESQSALAEDEELKATLDDMIVRLKAKMQDLQE